MSLLFRLVLLLAALAGPLLRQLDAREGSVRPNVLLITVDTFRPDRLGAYGHTRDTSPELDALAADGVMFRNTVSSSSWTTPGLLSALTGLWAPALGVDVRGKSLRPGTPTMATVLREAGYAAPDILYLSSIPNLQNLGLTPSYADRDRYLPEGDRVLFEALEAYADSTFFLYYHYRNLHLPYNPSSPYDRMYTSKDFDRSGFVKDRVDVVRSNVTIPRGSVRFTPADTAWVRGLYDGQIREMDDTFFKPLVGHLKRLGLYEKTVVIVTADHGEELLEHGFIGHPSTSFKANVYDEAILIPWIMTGPGLPAGTVVDAQVRNVDILPTVLHLTGIPIPDGVQGRSQMSRILGRDTTADTAYVETTPGGYQATLEMLKTRIRAVRTERWKLIQTTGPAVDAVELYDLRSDPFELDDVSSEHPETVTALRRALHRWVLASAAPAAEAAPAGPQMEGRVGVVYPADGDTIHYAGDGHSVAPEWTGPGDGAYVIEYRVGKGDYHLTGQMPVAGASPRYGPYTEEMWNMLALYNPFEFRVYAAGQPESASEWVRFTVKPTTSERPGPLTMVRALLGFWWTEAAYLVVGLGAGALLLLSAAADVPVDWVVSVVLLVAIACALGRSALTRLGPERMKRWSVVAGYTLFIYLTLPVMPWVWRRVWSLTEGRADYLGGIVVAAAGLAFLVHAIVRRPGWLRLAAGAILGAIYGWLLLSLGTSPAERLHLAEYGVLSYFTLRALQVDVSEGRAYFLGWLIAAALGTLDEGIQWLLPTRVFEWKDVGLNILSSGLGMLVIAVVQTRPQSDSRAEGGGF